MVEGLVGKCKRYDGLSELCIYCICRVGMTRPRFMGVAVATGGLGAARHVEHTGVQTGGMPWAYAKPQKQLSLSLQGAHGAVGLPGVRACRACEGDLNTLFYKCTCYYQAQGVCLIGPSHTGYPTFKHAGPPSAACAFALSRVNTQRQLGVQAKPGKCSQP